REQSRTGVERVQAAQTGLAARRQTGQVEAAKDPDDDPAKIDLSAPSKAGRVLSAVMVSMPALADCEPCDDRHVGREAADRSIRRARVTETVDSSPGEKVVGRVKAGRQQTRGDTDDDAHPPT